MRKEKAKTEGSESDLNENDMKSLLQNLALRALRSKDFPLATGPNKRD